MALPDLEHSLHEVPHPLTAEFAVAVSATKQFQSQA